MFPDFTRLLLPALIFALSKGLNARPGLTDQRRLGSLEDLRAQSLSGLILSGHLIMKNKGVKYPSLKFQFFTFELLSSAIHNPKITNGSIEKIYLMS